MLYMEFPTGLKVESRLFLMLMVSNKDHFKSKKRPFIRAISDLHISKA